jgi:hypothetical protein
LDELYNRVCDPHQKDLDIRAWWIENHFTKVDHKRVLKYLYNKFIDNGEIVVTIGDYLKYKEMDAEINFACCIICIKNILCTQKNK